MPQMVVDSSQQAMIPRKLRTSTAQQLNVTGLVAREFCLPPTGGCTHAWTTQYHGIYHATGTVNVEFPVALEQLTSITDEGANRT